MAKLLLLNGPNLNTLGQREPEIYGRDTLADIEGGVRKTVEAAGHQLWCYQSNSEGALIDWLQEHRDAGFLVFNPGAFTHTSIALRDCLAGLAIPFVEVHISNIHKREAFRHHSYLAGIAEGQVVGLGAIGYELAAQFALDFLGRNPQKRP